MIRLILTLLLLAGPALAQSWSAGVATDSGPVEIDQSFTLTFSGSEAGEAPTIDMERCSNPTVTLAGSDTRVSVSSCPSTTHNASQCSTPLGLPLGSDFGPLSIALPHRYLSVIIVDDGSSGGTLTASCESVPGYRFSGNSWAATNGMQQPTSASYSLNVANDATASTSSFKLFETGASFAEVSGSDPRNEWTPCTNITDRACLEFTRADAVDVPIRVRWVGYHSISIGGAEAPVYTMYKANAPANEAALLAGTDIYGGFYPSTWFHTTAFAIKSVVLERTVLMSEGDYIAPAFRGDGTTYNMIMTAGSGLHIEEVDTPPLQ